MTKSKFFTPIITICSLLGLFFTIYSCSNSGPKDRGTPSDNKTKIIEESTPEIVPVAITKEINKVNFYFENSGSINGYLKEDNFLEAMTRILGGVNSDQLESFFVNTQLHKENNIQSKIEKGLIKKGNTHSSDHQLIFQKAIESAVNNNISIVVTDGIYSVNGKSPNLVAVKIEQSFEKSLIKNEIETVVYKMLSNYDGTYYTESSNCGNTKINQSRPYYIVLFGDKEIIDQTLSKIVVKSELPGFENEARFSLNKNIKSTYTVLTKGEEKIGGFKSKEKYSNNTIHAIIDAEKSQGNGASKEKFLQFGVAVDFTDMSISNSYITNKDNYSVEENTSYTVEEIIPILDLSKSSKSYALIEKNNTNHNASYSHIIVLKGKTNLFGNLLVKLEKNSPQWIGETGTDNDCDIKGDSTTTFAFDYLMKGVSKAYSKVNKKNSYLELNINIKP